MTNSSRSRLARGLESGFWVWVWELLARMLLGWFPSDLLCDFNIVFSFSDSALSVRSMKLLELLNSTTSDSSLKLNTILRLPRLWLFSVSLLLFELLLFPIPTVFRVAEFDLNSIFLIPLFPYTNSLSLNFKISLLFSLNRLSLNESKSLMFDL